MGFNTTVLILNDAVNYISEDKDFGAKLADAIRGYNVVSKESTVGKHGRIYIKGAKILTSHHADRTSILAVGGNSGVELYQSDFGQTHHKEEDKITLLKKLAKKLGYSIRKLPKKKEAK